MLTDLDESSSDKSSDKSDEARNDGGDVGAGGDTDVLEQGHGIEDDGVAA